MRRLLSNLTRGKSTGQPTGSTASRQGHKADFNPSMAAKPSGPVTAPDNSAGTKPGSANREVPAAVHAVLSSPGHPVESKSRAELEAKMGSDFSGVRVHSDVHASESARATGARAYTVGRDIVFGEGQYKPQTPAGRQLLAHELTHVAQQKSARSVEVLTVGPRSHPAEVEAERVSSRISAGVPVGQPITPVAERSLQRSVAGDIGGTLGGAAVGAGAGFAIGGPIGALVGGLVGGFGGLILGDTLSADKRGLTPPEKQEAQLVFGNGLNYGGVKIAESPIMGIAENARTPFDTIYFPPGTSKRPFSDFMPWLIHELTHVWQYQHGVSVFTKLFWALHGAKAYDYGGEPALKLAAAQHKSFRSFNTEQQGDILRDYYNKLKDGLDTSAYDPFVNEVQGKKLGDFPSPETATKFA